MDILDTKSTKIGYACAFLSAILFGSISTLAKPTVETVSPLLLAALVSFIAAAVLTPLTYKAKFNISKRNLGLILIVSILGAVIAPSLYFFGLEYTTASDATILSNSEIIFTVILALLFFKERLKRTGYFSMALVFIGIILIATNFEFDNFVLEPNIGNLLIIGTMALWAIDNNISKIITKSVNVARIVQLKSLISGVILIGLVFLLGISIDIDQEKIPNIILLGTIGFALPMFFFYNAIKRIGAVRTILIFSTSAIFGVIYASIFLGEQIREYQVIAMIIMLAGIFIMHRE